MQHSIIIDIADIPRQKSLKLEERQQLDVLYAGLEQK